MTEKSKYYRDKRSPVPKSEMVSKVMSSIRSKNTSPELTLRKVLCEKGLKGYRLHYKKIPGSPDITFVGKKVAIFINGCFWHRCPKCDLPQPKHNTSYWIQKFERTKERDVRKSKELKQLGWKVITIWDCELKSDMASIIKKIKTLLT